MYSLRNEFVRLQKNRGFDVEAVLKKKARLINAYFEESSLNSVVLGVSGGIDSAVVLGLLLCASKQEESPIEKVLSLLLPISHRGASDQDISLSRGRMVVETLGGDCWECPLGAVQEEYIRSMNQLSSGAWSEGQLLSVVRTPALYYAAAQLQHHGYRSLVAGTINRDEGAYLGFFGKASDGMVDIQPISDLHKHEVYALGDYFGVPKEVMEAPPTGNVYDGRIDEEMLGAPYWFVSLFLMAKSQGVQINVDGLSTDERQSYDHWRQALESQHQKNKHKYRVGSPAIHLDVLPRAIPGGWE
jgi:NAD+ synthetase